MKWLNGITDLTDKFKQAPGVGDGQGNPIAAVNGVAKSQTQLSDWTELNWTGSFAKETTACLLAFYRHF